jgi:cytochrome c oxidase assembly protein subunit 15
VLNRSTHNPGLHQFTLFTAFSTLVLICAGGVVTSKGAGMSVPDWPTSYGYNMFYFPWHQWSGGAIFYEHSHRLLGSWVGFLTLILAGWLWLRDSRKWMRVLGVVAVFAVCIQGLLGGLRVTLYKDEIGIFHGALAQLFFVLICAMALFTSKTWQGLHSYPREGNPTVRNWVLGTTLLVMVQLLIGATMRHQHAGLAIPDFPLAYGKVLPDISPEAIERYNQQRVEVHHSKEIKRFHIVLQMVHRFAAALIVIGVCISARKVLAAFPFGNPIRTWAWLWVGLIGTQFYLGAATIWTDKSADIATAHVAVGALSLMVGSVLTIIALRLCPSRSADPVLETSASLLRPQS